MRTSRSLLLLALAMTLLSGCNRQTVPASLWQSSPAVRQIEQRTEQGQQITQILLRPKGGDDAGRFLSIATGDMRDVLQAMYLYFPEQRPDILEFRLQAPLVSRSGNSALVELIKIRFDTRKLQSLDWQSPPSPAKLLAATESIEQLEPVAQKLLDAYCQQPEYRTDAGTVCQVDKTAK